jgi:hypothetical protein
MNATSRAILQTILSTDDSLLVAERNATQRLINGRVEDAAVGAAGADEFLLVTQKRAAELLSVSRATIWRDDQGLSASSSRNHSWHLALPVSRDYRSYSEGYRNDARIRGAPGNVCHVALAAEYLTRPVAR